MHIEKINSNQIRCTLNKHDLDERHIRLTELAYGTDETNALFRDMVEQASYELDFDTEEGVSLMIDAIPMLPDTLVLLITKVNDPKELNPLFSMFTDDVVGDFDLEDIDEQEFNDLYDRFDDVKLDEDDVYNEDDFLPLDILPFSEEKKDVIPFSYAGESDKSDDVCKDDVNSEREVDFISLPEVLGMEPKTSHVEEKQAEYFCVYKFASLDSVSYFAEEISAFYNGNNSLYKDKEHGEYYLVFYGILTNVDRFNRLEGIISEYASRCHYPKEIYLEEHFETIIKEKAVQILASL